MSSVKTKKGSGVHPATIEQIATADLVPNESWRAIGGHAGYEVSDAGRVRSVDRTLPDGRRFAGRILNPWAAGAGYMAVTLGRQARQYVHRLVAVAFHGEPVEPRSEVAHKDGTKTNNAANNLVWATHAENERHKRDHGTYARPRVFWAPGQRKRGPKSSRHENADQIVHDRNNGMSLSCLAKKYGMSKSGMSGVLRRRV